MPINDNSQSIRLYESLKKNISQTEADEFTTKLSLSKSATFERKFKWAEDICAYLESKYSENDIKSIRMNCACGPSEGRMKKLKQLYISSHSLEEFVDSYNKSNTDSTIWCEGKTLFFSYPACYCSCVKRMAKPISKTWCYCTLGYTKKMFDYALACDTDVELIESIKTGGSKCVMSIRKKI